jgi:hypothetical protein
MEKGVLSRRIESLTNIEGTVKWQAISGGSKQSEGSQRGGSGNFANDPQRASEEGKKGSQHSQQGTKDSQAASHKNQRGGSGNFANDPEKASDARSKGGQHSQGGSSK